MSKEFKERLTHSVSLIPWQTLINPNDRSLA